MARNLVLTAVLAMAAVALAAGEAGAQAKRVPPPPAALAGLTPPTGTLQLVGLSAKMAVFLDRSRTRTEGGITEVWALQVFDPPYRGGYGDVVTNVTRGRLDCGKDTYASLGTRAYDEGGALTLWLDPEPAQPMETNSPEWLTAQVVCRDGMSPFPPVEGRAAAVAQARELMRKARAGQPITP